MSKKYALISVSDKSGVSDLAKKFTEKGISILSTGGTAKHLKEMGVDVIDVSDHTGFPEMMDGRVKTLHPRVHGGLLCLRSNEEHMAQASSHDIQMIDFVVVNLYPFEETIAKPGVKLIDAIENIDIGGPSMLRSAAKNYASVTVLTHPEDYPEVMEELDTAGETSIKTRERLAIKVFEKTAEYDSAIHTFLGEKLLGKKNLHLHYQNGVELRYGENPHQAATVYKDSGKSKDNPVQGVLLHGKAMSYNNYLDAEASWETSKDFRDKAACVIIKHGNPCGLATGENLREAMEMAWEGDVVSAFGSVISFTREVDLATAEFLKGKFVEIVMAPGYTDEAIHFLKEKSKDLRILKITMDENVHTENHRPIAGGLLTQAHDNQVVEKMEAVTQAAFEEKDEAMYLFAFKTIKHIKSNAISLVHEYKPGKHMLLGMGAGQPNRVDAIRKLAVPKAKENIERLYGEENTKNKMKDVVLASDAFFPFPDNIEVANESGIKKIIQPGGSKKDPEVIAACDQYGITMVFTGMRHFLH